MNNYDLDVFKKIIRIALEKMYDEYNHKCKNNTNMIEVNRLCERCLVFRFAYHLQNLLPFFFQDDYFVDCDFNQSFSYNGQTNSYERIFRKPIEGKRRYVDIIVHKRKSPNFSNITDLICFEVKKIKNTNGKGKKKDQKNLECLTKDYGYKYGFHLFLGNHLDKCKIDIYQCGKKIEIYCIN